MQPFLATPPVSVLDRDDHGLFGPGHVVWRVHASPAALFGGVGSLMMEALKPRVVQLFVANTANQSGRLQRTIDYVLTTTYGRSDAVEAAGAQVRKVHSFIRGIDPDTGLEYRADRPDLLEWIHNVQIWAYCSAYQRFDTPLSERDRDAYVDGLTQVAALVGLDPATVPSTWRDLDAYVRDAEGLECTREATTGRRLLFDPPRSELPSLLFYASFRLAAWAGFSIMPRRYRELYDIGWNDLTQAAVTAVSLAGCKGLKLLMPEDRQIRRLVQHVEDAPFATAARTV